MEKSSAAKKSIIISGLIGTGGMFISKLIGLIYTIPFSYILSSEAYLGVYSQAYNLYAYLLTIFQSGIPFAIATLVARYMVFNDAKSVLLLKKIAISILGATGFIGMLILLLSSNAVAPLMVADDPETIEAMARSLRLLSIALFLVPLLSAFRGYYQGLKEMEEYAFSQAFEQIFRVAFLLTASCLFVYILGFDRKYALYAGVLSTSVAALAAVLQFLHFDKKNQIDIKEQAKHQEKAGASQKKLLKQILSLAIPYLIVAMLGNVDSLFNSFLLPTGLKKYYSVADQTTVIQAVNYVASKLNAIPMILGPGFATAIIPHISEALSKKDLRLVRKNILDSIHVVLYVAIPISFCIFAYAGPLNYALYYSENLELSIYVVQWMALEGFLGTIVPLVTNLLVSLELRKQVIKVLIINTIIKAVLTVPFVSIFGVAGTVMVSLIATIYVLYSNFKLISKNYHVSYKRTLSIFIRIMIGVLALYLTSLILSKLGLYAITGSKLVCLIKTCINGLISVIVYLIVTIWLKVPQNVFHIRFKKRSERHV